MPPVSQLQLVANQRNSLKSTGPKTDSGKNTSKVNATKHGFFSKTILSTESKEEYNMFFDGLMDELQPVGILELNSIEQISQLIWKQRRLATAESASIELSMLDQKMLSEISELINDKWLSVVDLEKLEQEKTLDVDLVKEVSQLPGDLSYINFINFPTIKSRIDRDAKHSNISFEEFVKGIDLQQYLAKVLLEILQLKKVNTRNSVIKKVKNLVKESRTTGESGSRELFSKYSVTIQNQLNKAITQLRELQDRRLLKIHTTTSENGFVWEK